MSDEDVLTISSHFGPSLVSVPFRRRVSFADAWRDPALREHAINCAVRVLNREQRAARKASSAVNEQISVINNLLLDVAIQEGFRADRAAKD